MLKKKLVVGALILGAVSIPVLFSSSAFAQWWGYGMGGHYGMMGSYRGTGMMGWNRNVPEKYWLSARQIDKIRETRSNYDDRIFPLQQKLYSLRIEAQGYASDPDADAAKIRSYNEDIRGLQGQIDNFRLDARAEFAKVLSKDQRAYFSNDFDWWYDEPGMRGTGYGYGMRGYMMGRSPMMSGWGCW